MKTTQYKSRTPILMKYSQCLYTHTTTDRINTPLVVSHHFQSQYSVWIIILVTKNHLVNLRAEHILLE